MLSHSLPAGRVPHQIYFFSKKNLPKGEHIISQVSRTSRRIRIKRTIRKSSKRKKIRSQRRAKRRRLRKTKPRRTKILKKTKKRKNKRLLRRRKRKKRRISLNA